MKTFPGSHVLTAHHGRSAGRHWLRFNLSAQPNSNRGHSTLREVDQRSTVVCAKNLDCSVQGMDIGIQAGFERGSGEWVLDARTVKTLADLETPVRVTIYSPLLLMHERVPRKRR